MLFLGRLKRIHRYPSRTGIFTSRLLHHSSREEESLQGSSSQAVEHETANLLSSSHQLLPVEEKPDSICSFSRFRFTEIKLTEDTLLRNLLDSHPQLTNWYLQVKQGQSVSDRPGDNIVLRNIHTNVFISEDQCTQLVREWLNWPIEKSPLVDHMPIYYCTDFEHFLIFRRITHSDLDCVVNAGVTLLYENCDIDHKLLDAALFKRLQRQQYPPDKEEPWLFNKLSLSSSSSLSSESPVAPEPVPLDSIAYQLPLDQDQLCQQTQLQQFELQNNNDPFQLQLIQQQQQQQHVRDLSPPPPPKRRKMYKYCIANKGSLVPRISRLPEYLLIVHVFPFLCVKEVQQSCALINRKWYQMCHHPSLWKRFVIAQWGPIQRFSNIFLNAYNALDWKHYFVSRFMSEKYVGSGRFNLSRKGTLETSGLHREPLEETKVITFEALNLQNRLAISLDRHTNSIIFKVQQFHSLKRICFLGKMSFDFEHFHPLDSHTKRPAKPVEILDEMRDALDVIISQNEKPMKYSLDWKLKYSVDSTPTIAKGNVVVYNTTANTLSALDIRTGENNWSTELPIDIIYNMCDFYVCVVGSNILIPTQNGLDIYRLTDGRRSAVIRPSNNTIAQLLKNTPSLEEGCPSLTQFVYSSIAIENDMCVWLYERDSIPYLMVANVNFWPRDKYSTAHSQLQQKQQQQEWPSGSIIAAHNLSMLCNFDKLNKHSCVSLNDGRLFLNSTSTERSEGYLFIIEPVSGTVMWSYVSNSPFMSKPMVHQNMLIFACVLGIFCLDIGKLELLWHYQLELSEHFMTRVECTGPILTLHDNIVHYAYYEYTPGSGSFNQYTDDEQDIEDAMIATNGTEEKMKCHITAIHVLSGKKLWTKRLENVLLSDSVRVINGNMIAPFHSPNGLGGVIWLR